MNAQPLSSDATPSVGLPVSARRRSTLTGSLRRLGVLVLLGVWGCAPKQPAPVDLETMQQQQALASTPHRSQALEMLRLASMALERDERVLAEQALRDAIGLLGAPGGGGQIRSLVGTESTKDWKGEPYERMAAYLTLGNVLYASGDRDNALAMYKSALLADTGTEQEAFRSDFVSAWTLQALVYQAEGETENARRTMERAVDALWVREVTETLDDALVAVGGGSGATVAEQRAQQALLTALPGGVAVAPRDPVRAMEATQSRAIELLQSQRHLAPWKRMQGFGRFTPDDFSRAADEIPRVVREWQREAALRDLAGHAQVLGPELEGLLKEAPNVVIIVENGRGPTKARLGEHGEQLSIVVGHESGPPDLRVDGGRVAGLPLDSLSYQATTRGGRRVDAWLRGKAMYRDTGLVTGYVLLYLSQELAYAGEGDAARLVAIVGAGIFATAALTMPVADTRAWEQVPEAWYLLAGRWEPGEHLVTVGRRTITVEVPVRGQVVGFVPARGTHQHVP